MNKTKIILILLSAALLTYLTSFLLAASNSVGAVNHFYTTSNSNSLSVDIQPLWGEEGYHFYSLSTLFQSKGYGMYAGIQTNGNLGNSTPVGNLFIFSVWNATKAFPASGAVATPFGGEGIGYSLRLKYDWKVGTKYRITIARGAYDNTNKGYRFKASITNLSNNSVTNIGEITAPTGDSALSSGSIFHERYSGSGVFCTAGYYRIEKAGARFTNLKSSSSISLSPTPAPNNVFQSSLNCDNHIHYSGNTSSLLTGFGVTQSEFNSPPTNFTEPAPSNPTTPSTSSTPSNPAPTQNNTSQPSTNTQSPTSNEDNSPSSSSSSQSSNNQSTNQTTGTNQNTSAQDTPKNNNKAADITTQNPIGETDIESLKTQTYNNPESGEQASTINIPKLAAIFAGFNIIIALSVVAFLERQTILNFISTKLSKP